MDVVWQRLPTGAASAGRGAHRGGQQRADEQVCFPAVVEQKGMLLLA